MAFRCTPAIKDPVGTLVREPWSIAVKPFQVAPGTWYVAGQTWVGCYLIDTGDGLILLDTAIPESSYLLVDSIYRLGFAPEQIKKILISHAHFDHCGAAMEMKKLTGAEVYMSREDWEFYQKCPEEVMFADSGSHIQDFTVDHFYSDDEPIVLGNVEIRTLLTPGHTPGSVCYEAGDALFTGDTLFAQGYGRTDLLGGSEEAMRASLRRVTPLRENHTIYAGHGS